MQSKEERAAAEAALAPKPVAPNPADEMVEMPDGTVLTFAERRGFGQIQQSLAYPERPGFHRHWFNDSPGRLLDARDAGYTPVMGRDGKAVTAVVDKTTGMLAHLHEIPLSWYKADLAAGQKAADEKEAAIRKGAAPAPDGSAPGLQAETTYGKISISRKASG